jgi:hypothetical protein
LRRAQRGGPSPAAPPLEARGDACYTGRVETTAAWFEAGGPANTDETLRLAAERARALGARHAVVASYSGRTGARAADLFRGVNLVVVGGVYGFREPNRTTMEAGHRSVIETAGARVLFAGHAFGMLGRAVHRKFGALQADELIAHVLRLLSQGFKVACEVACMAVDAGLVPAGEETVAIGGTGQGADTAIVLRPANTHAFFDTRILEIICKPRG